ncbi:MAG TPA: type II toxin-antitoxin system prevent-host-death family antitoxin [Candidatus Didemnitutus sp.]|jgi:prevent-host-death family protein
MKTVSIRELHTRTGHYVRAAAREPLAVTERGAAIARLVPLSEPAGRTFAERRLRPGFKRFLATPLRRGTDSTRIVSEDRDR